MDTTTYGDATSVTDAQAIAALAAYLDIDADDITVGGYGDRTEYDAGGLGEFLVLTDDEADAATREGIERSLWAFLASFLASETGLPELAFSRLAGMCEDANDAFRAMIDATCGLDDFVSAAIAAEGRGHFLSAYDGDELELDTPAGRVYAYRVN